SPAALTSPPPFPTRRSSDLGDPPLVAAAPVGRTGAGPARSFRVRPAEPATFRVRTERLPVGRTHDGAVRAGRVPGWTTGRPRSRSEEHTSELQSRENLVCRL